jgi:hypothetical protein
VSVRNPHPRHARQPGKRSAPSIFLDCPQGKTLGARDGGTPRQLTHPRKWALCHSYLAEAYRGVDMRSEPDPGLKQL